MHTSSEISNSHTSNILGIIQGLTEDLNIAYQITNLDGKILEFNEQWTQLVELECLTRSDNFFNLISIANKEKIKQAYCDLELNERSETTLKITNSRNRTTAYQIHFYKIQIANEGEDFVLGVYNKKSTVIRSHKPDQWAYLQIINKSNEAIIQLNKNWELIEINKKGLEFTGYSKDELLGTNLKHLIHPDHLKKTCELYQIQSKEKIATTVFEIPIQLKSGNQRWIRQKLHILFNDNGEVSGYLGLSSDVTEIIYLKKQLSITDQVLEKRVTWRTKELEKINIKLRNEIDLKAHEEEVLRESEKEYRSLFQNANDAIVIIDAQTEQVLEVNDIACEIYGWSKNNFLKKSFKDTLGSKAGLERNLILQTLSQKKYYVGEIVIEVRHEKITLDVHANEVVYRGRKSILCVNRDITLKKGIQKELLNEKIRGMSALIDGQEMERRRFSKELHDGLGQLLTTSSIYLNQLKKNVDTNSLEIVTKVQGIIQDTMDEVRSISHNLMPSVLDDFGLPLALKNMVNNLGKSVETNIKLEVQEGMPRLNPEIEIGLYRIAQEGLNNALKHAKGAKIAISLKQKKETVELVIKDSGKGFIINSDYMTKGGNGISNMAQRASSIGCQFKIKSDKGKGTKIWVQYILPHG